MTTLATAAGLLSAVAGLLAAIAGRPVVAASLAAAVAFATCWLAALGTAHVLALVIGRR